MQSKAGDILMCTVAGTDAAAQEFAAAACAVLGDGAIVEALTPKQIVNNK